MNSVVEFVLEAPDGHERIWCQVKTGDTMDITPDDSGDVMVTPTDVEFTDGAGFVLVRIEGPQQTSIVARIDDAVYGRPSHEIVLGVDDAVDLSHVLDDDHPLSDCTLRLQHVGLPRQRVQSWRDVGNVCLGLAILVALTVWYSGAVVAGIGTGILLCIAILYRYYPMIQ